MSQTEVPLIGGAGPVGLGAALFVTRNGRSVRIVEMRDEPSRESKALAVNPRTLEILEPTGLSQQMLERGLPIREAQLHRGEHVVAVISFAGIHARYPFMLALSQASTERLLAESLKAAGGQVERGIKLVECQNTADGVEAVLVGTDGTSREVVNCPWLLAAEGAHSAARRQLGIDFVGSSFAEPWYLADVPLRTRLAPDRAHVFLRDAGGFLFLIRVIDDVRHETSGDPIWRVISSSPEPLGQLTLAEPAGPPIWESSFHIAHRINTTLAAGNIYFAGDAAHVHSPMGARGMNLGLEDAWVFSELVRTERLSDYDMLRHPVDQRVMRQVEFMSKIIASKSALVRFVRQFIFPNAIKIPLVRSPLVMMLTGLDHELPQLAAEVVQATN